MGQEEVQQYNLKQQQRYAKKTGFVVDIQNIGKNTQTIAKPVPQSFQEIYNNVWVSTEAMELDHDNFTNVYNLFWSPKNIAVTSEVHSEKSPYYLLDYVESDPSILAVINGSFFFLVDEVYQEPKEYPFHLCIRNGKVVGLPSSNEPIIFSDGQDLNAKEPQARGTIEIAGKTLTWIGSENKSMPNNADTILYNSGSSKIIKTFDPRTGVRVGMIDRSNIQTPLKKGVIDLVINANDNGALKITQITVGGGTHYFDGLFILQIPTSKSTFIIGDEVNPLTLDGLDLKTIASGISVGKNIRDPYFFVPERINSRDARSVIAKDVKGNIHFVVFDGCKYIPRFKGVSAQDIATYFSEDKYEWAYFLDGGSSSRIIARDGKKIKFLANEFAFKKITNDTFLWDWKRHRKLASCIVLKTKTQ